MHLRDRPATQFNLGSKSLTARQRMTFILVCLAMLLVPAHIVSASGGTEPPSGKLGFGFFVLAGNDENADGLEKNNRMWFAIEPGSTGSREFRVSSTSQVTQIMSMGLIPAVRENGGKLVAAPELSSDAASWVSFEPSKFDLAPGDSKTVKISFAPPIGTDPVFIESFIEVNANKKAAQASQYAIPTALATNFPVTLTVGNVDQLAINFEILDVEGFLDDAGPQLRVYVKNAGRTPISPSGFVQFSSLDFDSVRSDELKFAGTSIFPNKVGSIDVPVSDPVTAGKWRVLVSASQGSTRITEIFEKDLTFDGPPKGLNIPFSMNWERILLALFAILLLVIAKRSGSKSPSGGSIRSRMLAFSSSGALNALAIWWKNVTAEIKLDEQSEVYADNDAPSIGLEPLKDPAVEHVIAEEVTDSTDEIETISAVRVSENPNYKSVLRAVSKWVQSAQAETAVSVNPEAEQIIVEVSPINVQTANQDLDEFQVIKLQSEKLRELQELFTDGIISKTQFDRKRKEILDRL